MEASQTTAAVPGGFTEPGRAAAVADEMESCLWRHVLDPWFPRCLDRQYGGFLVDFDHAWRASGEHIKQLETQARQAAIAAEASSAFPEHADLREAARRGLEVLRDVMWDRNDGGWFHRTNRAGEPQQAGTKHTHGFAYSLSACASLYRATGDEGALALAKQAFGWLDTHAHDPVHGAYFGMMRRDGGLVLSEEQNPLGLPLDTIGLPLGYKDLNCLTDMVEALNALYGIWPNDLVRERLEEIATLLVEKVVTPSGAMHFLNEADWTPVPGLERFGYGLQGCHRLLRTGALLGNEEACSRTARRMFDHILDVAWDHQTRGFILGAQGTEHFDFDGRQVDVRSRLWWLQFEGLRSLLDLALGDGSEGIYWRRFLDLWSCVRDSYFDARHGGLFPEPIDSLPTWQRRLVKYSLAPPPWPKGDSWKDASHEGCALLHCSAGLRRMVSRPGREEAQSTNTISAAVKSAAEVSGTSSSTVSRAP